MTIQREWAACMRGAGVVLLAIAAAGVPARASSTTCTPITSLPITINQPGYYCLASNLTVSLSSGFAIIVNTSNVTIDLNGYTIADNAGPTTQATGVYAFNQNDVVVRNGSLRGFWTGVNLYSQMPTSPTLQGLLVEDVVCENVTWTGIRIGGADGPIIRRCVVTNSTGSDPASGNGLIGIVVSGAAAWIVDNSVTKLAPGPNGSAWSIYLDRCPRSFVNANRIANDTALNSTGLYIGLSADVTVSSNQIDDTQYGVYFISSTGKFRDNITNGCTTPYTGGTNVGNNF